MTSVGDDENGTISGVVPAPAARLRAELGHVQEQIAAHRDGPPLRSRVVAAVAGAGIALLAAFSASLPSCDAAAKDGGGATKRPMSLTAPAASS
jgi:hypothetical protein